MAHLLIWGDAGQNLAYLYYILLNESGGLE
jgi:hypothetical protein